MVIFHAWGVARTFVCQDFLLFCGSPFAGFRKRTPAPPPFSSMNFMPGRLQRAAKRGFIGGSHRDRPLNDLHAPNCCDADSGGFGQIEGSPPKQGARRTHLSAAYFYNYLIFFIQYSMLHTSRSVATRTKKMTDGGRKITDSRSRRSFVGGSDARIIMGDDEGCPAPPLARKAR